jgi:nucleoid-associated protein YgaU
MAPPIPMPRPVPPRRRRSAGDVLIGLLAVLALAALTAGVPLALAAVVGNPVHGLTLSDLTHELDVFTILRVLSIVVWLAWLQLVWCVIAEIRAAVRNAGMPSQVPLAGGTQLLVHRLVTAALLLVTATSALAPALAQHAPAPPRQAPAAAAAATAGAGRSARTETAVTATRPSVQKYYVVAPPVGRYHESLWEIAQNHLGDGRRYGEIFELNSDRLQPDGSRLTISSLIRPGWVLFLPADAHGPGVHVVAPDQSPPAAGADAHHAAAGGAAPHAEAGAPADTAGSGGGALGSGAAGGLAATGVHAPPVSPGYGLGWADDLAVASLLAAGVLAALGRRRRVQLWQRAFGCQIAAPEPEAAAAEAALRLGAHEPSTRLLDLGLRQLGRELGRAGRIPPTVLAACIGTGSLDLWIAPVDHSAPAPWTAVDDGAVWRLPWAALEHLDPDLVADTVAPFPGLVSIGTDSGGRVLVDLEAAHGLISISGPPQAVTAALSAMAVELATNRWSDHMKITLVGFGADLTLLAPDRITAVPALADALGDLEARAAAVADALAASGVGSVLTGRSRGVHREAWTPHYLIMATPPTPEEQRRLLALAQVRHAAAAGYVVAGEVPGAAWTWQLSDAGQLIADPLGLDVRAQLLPPRQHAAVVELFATAQRAAGPELDPLPPSTVPPAQLVPGSVMPVEVTLLGPLSVRAPGVVDPDRLPVLTELVAFLAAHPGGVHPTVLSGAIWPRGVSAEVRDNALRRAREWLGTDAAGRPHLQSDPAGRLGLGDGVRVDWQVFGALAGLAARAGDPAAEQGYLTRALSLVGGQLMTGRPPGRYAWLATDGLEYEVAARVADAAHRLATLRLAGGDARGAMDAARTGLRLAYADELLWRDLLRGADATGDQKLVRAVVDGVYSRIALDEVLPRLAPETEALIDEICPSWRASVA